MIDDEQVRYILRSVEPVFNVAQISTSMAVVTGDHEAASRNRTPSVWEL